MEDWQWNDRKTSSDFMSPAVGVLFVIKNCDFLC